MGSFEWMEVETLSTEITALESRLAAAKSRHNYGLAKVVKDQIDAAQQRRARYLAHITTSLAGSLDPAAAAEKAPGKPPRQRGVVQQNPEEPAAPTAIEEEFAEPGGDRAAEDAPEEPADPVMPDVPEALAEPDQPSAEPADLIPADVSDQLTEPDRPIIEPANPIAASGAASPDADTIEGVSKVWDRLTPSQIERAKRDLGMHRAEMLARHAAELRALDADQSEIDALAQAIEAFVQKFKTPSAASVVRLDEPRERLQIPA